MRDLLQRPDLFSINTATLGYKTPLPAIIDACAARGIGAIAPWRRELQSEDLQQIARQLAASNMNVSGLCRSTYYTAPTLAERKLAIDDNRRALDDAAVTDDKIAPSGLHPEKVAPGISTAADLNGNFVSLRHVVLTAAQYAALNPVDPNTLYYISA